MNMKNTDLEKAIYRWFNMKYELYNKLDYDDSIYLYYDGEEYADIRIHKNYNYIFYKSDFLSEFFEVFPVELSDFKIFMVKWVEDTFNLEGFIPPPTSNGVKKFLKIDSSLFSLEIPK